MASVRNARFVIMGAAWARGVVWWLTALYVGAGVVGVGYAFYNSTKPFTSADVTSGIQGLSASPVAVQVLVTVAGWVGLLSVLPVLIGGLVRFRGWRRGSRLRGFVWTAVWTAGIALMVLAGTWGLYPEQDCANPTCPIPSPAVVSWGELPLCGVWLVFGALMLRMLAAPPARDGDSSGARRQFSTSAS